MPYPYVDEHVGAWLFADGRKLRADSPDAAPFLTPVDERMFYEVVRVQNGVPLFWEDHAARLAASVAGAFPLDESLLRRDAGCLLEASGVARCNLRIVKTALHTVLHLSPYYYPSDEMIVSGVPCGLLAWVRETPHVKTVREDYKQAVAGAFAAGGPHGKPFEILLADRSGRLTEGSRSNLFFVDDSTVYSAPDNSILLGITRRYVQRAVSDAGFRLSTELFTTDDLKAGRVTAAFLTGSPIDVLPISSIGDIPLDVKNPVVNAVRRRYAAILDDYIRHARAEQAKNGREARKK
jgi:branched-chain amino acid aminotransferase